MPVSPLDDGESLIGMVARSASENVLRDINVVLSDVGRRLKRPGFVGQVLDGLADRLAQKIGCDRQDVISRLHVEVDPSGNRARAGDNTRPVHWGGGAIERRYLDLVDRWISPSALMISGHHRAAWLCRLLPFCTETLEPLVNRCEACRAKLGWTQTRGVGTCERCRTIVRPSTGPKLDERHVPGYVWFAELISPVETVRATARRSLSPDLANLDPISLVRLVIGLGHRVHGLDQPFERDDRDKADERLLTAGVVATGAAMLHDWPRTLRERVSAAARSATTVAERAKVLEIRRASLKGSRESALLRHVLPEVFENQRRALCFGEPAALAKDASARLKGNISRFRQIEKALGFSGVDTAEGQRICRQYDARRIERVAQRLTDSVQLSDLTGPSGLARYAVEQLICLGELEQERDEAVVAMDPRMRLMKTSVSSLMQSLRQAYRSDDPSGKVMTLQQLSRCVGGRLKPWGSAIALLRSRDVPCWHRKDITETSCSNTMTFLARTLVRVDDASALFDRMFVEALYPDFPFAAQIDQRDALEIVNLGSPQANLLRAPDGLLFNKVGKALLTDRDAVLELARKVVGVSELAATLDQTPSYVTRMMVRMDQFERFSIGWSREQVVENWSRVVGAVQEDAVFRRRRRAVSKRMTDGQIQVGHDRLKASLPCKG